MWLMCRRAAYGRVGDVCGWQGARSGVVCCACWPGRPGAVFRSWGGSGSLSSVPRCGGVPVGVCVAFGVSSWVCALRVVALAYRV